MDKPVIALTIAYDGASFAGFTRQRQQATVQGRIEEALQTVLRRDVETVGAGRTDAGVHALGQVVSFQAVGDEPEPAELVRSLNALAGPEIAATQFRLARPGFSARFDAMEREYRYRIVDGPTPPVFLQRVAWWVKKNLDEEAMNEAAQALVGEHDFRSFCVAESAEGKNTVRLVSTAEVERHVECGEQHLVFRIVGNAFLHSMVRVVVGTLVEVGSGKQPGEWVTEVLAARRRDAAGQTAPAQGLTMWSVVYPDEVWL